MGAGLVGTSASGQTLDLVKKMDPSAKLLGSEAQDIAHQEKLRLSNILRRHKEGKRVRNLAAEAPQLLPKSRAHACRAPMLEPVDHSTATPIPLRRYQSTDPRH